MTGMDTVNPRLDEFVTALRLNLSSPKNVSKGDWRRMLTESLLARLHDEFLELAQAVNRGPMDEIVFEACDVAAFAFMIADRTVYARPHPR